MHIWLIHKPQDHRFSHHLLTFLELTSNLQSAGLSFKPHPTLPEHPCLSLQNVRQCAPVSHVHLCLGQVLESCVLLLLPNVRLVVKAVRALALHTAGVVRRTFARS